MHNVNNQSLNVNVNKNVVKLLMINVCGLVKRIQYPEFMELIEGYDIQLTLIVSNSVDSNLRLSRIFIEVPNFVVYKYI